MDSVFNMTIMSKPFLDVFTRQTLLLMEHLKVEVDSKEHFDIWPYIFKSSFGNIIGELEYYCKFKCQGVNYNYLPRKGAKE